MNGSKNAARTLWRVLNVCIWQLFPRLRRKRLLILRLCFEVCSLWTNAGPFAPNVDGGGLGALQRHQSDRDGFRCMSRCFRGFLTKTIVLPRAVETSTHGTLFAS